MRATPMALVALALGVACGDKAPGDGGPGDDPWSTDGSDGGDGGSAPVDADGDGVPADEDCDDRAAGVYPGAPEVCDGRDNDCDRRVDDDDDDVVAETADPFYADGDGDGFGDDATEVRACTQPEGLVAQAGDCDDGDPSVNPGAREVCDPADVDEDCSGAADDADLGVDPTTQVTVYRDEDGDGWGDAADPGALWCDPPSDAVSEGGDCDDAEAAVNPGATEVCDGGDVDEDCSGAADDADPGVDPVTQTATVPDADGDGYGDATATPTRYCDPPAGVVTDRADCDDSDAAVNPGAAEVCDPDDVDEDCSGLADDADPGLDTSSWLSWYADGDGDGYGDPGDRTRACAAPSGAVADSTDCDDADATIHPGQAERCDGIDTDCDRSTGEAGVATFTSASGSTSSYTSRMTGTAASPAAATFSTDGTLSVCDGTWYATLAVSADLAVVNPGGDEMAVVLDGGDSGAVVEIDGDGLTVALSDLTLQGGAGSELLYGPGYEVGGALFCDAGTSSGSTTVDLDNVVLTDSVAFYGGALGAYGCAVTTEDVQITDNVADSAGGAAYIAWGSWDDTDGLVQDNASLDRIGAVWLYSSSGTMDGSLWSDNEASDEIGAVALTASDLACAGTSSATAGILGATAGDTTDGAIYLSASTSSTFDADRCDLGAGADDSAGPDLHLARSDFDYEYGDDATFTCDRDRCGTSTTYSVGGDTYANSADGYARGMVLEATDTHTLDDFTVMIDVLERGCAVDFYVLSNSSFRDAGWTVEWSDTASPVLGATSVSSGDIGLAFEDGTTYALVAGWDCEATYHYVSGSSTGSGLGTGTWKGYHADYAYTGYSGASVSLDVGTSLVYQFEATTSH